MFRVRGGDPRLALRGPWSGALAAMQLASVPTTNGGILTRRAPTCPSKAALTRPIAPETRSLAGFDKGCVVSLIH